MNVVRFSCVDMHAYMGSRADCWSTEESQGGGTC